MQEEFLPGGIQHTYYTPPPGRIERLRMQALAVAFDNRHACDHGRFKTPGDIVQEAEVFYNFLIKE